MPRFLYIIITIVILQSEAFCQSTANFVHPDKYYRNGLRFMHSGKFTAAMDQFEQYLERGNDEVKISDAAYYKAFCAVQLRNTDGEALIEEYIRQYPNSTKAQLAYFELGKLNYAEKKYTQAIIYFEKSYLSQLSQVQADEAHFKLGYSYFTQKEFDRAYTHFDALKRTANQYQYPSSYYAGYINYEKGEYDRAYYDFKRIEDNEAYAKVVPALLAKVLYRQGLYDELIQYANEALNKPGISEKQELQLYLGEAYYMKNNYNKAAEYFSDYTEAKKSKPDRGLLFRIADTQQKAGHTEDAINNFKEVALIDDTLGLYASYYLGNLYLQEGNKPFALTAYLKTRDGKVDPVVREEAAFKYAEVQYDLRNYDMAITAIAYHREMFPESDRIEKSDEILTRAYLNSNNYDAAIAHFEKIKNRSKTINAAYQKVTFLKGTELFNQQKFPAAVQMFDQSLAYPENREYVIKANFWKGEAFAIGHKDDEALASYAAVFRSDLDGSSNEYLKSRYGIGYIYFNQKDYNQALGHFKYYTDVLKNKSEKLNYADALVRLADCYYATKQYQASMVVLNDVIKVNPGARDYAYFRKGVIYGILGDLSTANSNFDMVINNYDNSRHHVNAIYQKGRFNFEAGNYEMAIRLFSMVINKYPESSFVPFAYQDRAIAHSNLGNPDQSIRDYAAIINEYPNHDLASDALLGLQEVLGQVGRSSSFDEYLVKYKNANPGSNELESIEFGAAKNLYFNQDYEGAINALERFGKDYPLSAFLNEAQYYRSDAYFRTGNFKKSLDGFYQLAEYPQFSRHGRVIERIMEAEYALKNYPATIAGARRLEKIAGTKRDEYSAWHTMMDVYFQMQQYDSADFFAHQILERGLVAPDAESQALLLLGKSAYQQNHYDEAENFFLSTANVAKDVNGAEAMYLLAQMQHEQGNFKQSTETLFELNNNFSSYDYWLGRSFLLIADNYIAEEEYFQAKATLESLVAHAPDQEIVEKAGNRLKDIAEFVDVPEYDTPDTLEIENAQEYR